MNKVWINTEESYVQSIKCIVRQDLWQGLFSVPLSTLLERLMPVWTTDRIWDILYRQLNTSINNSFFSTPGPRTEKET